MGTVTPIRGKSEQRVTQVISILKNAGTPMSYDDIRLATGAEPRGPKKILYGGVAYDQLLFILTTLIEVGYVEKTEEARHQGRPRMFFRWKPVKAARAGGARISA